MTAFKERMYGGDYVPMSILIIIHCVSLRHRHLPLQIHLCKLRKCVRTEVLQYCKGNVMERTLWLPILSRRSVARALWVAVVPERHVISTSYNMQTIAAERGF